MTSGKKCVIRGTRKTSYMLMLQDRVAETETETYLGNYMEYRDAELACAACNNLLNLLKSLDKL